MKKLLFIPLFFIVNACLAQNQTFKARADKAFADKDYITAAYYYDKALENGTTTSQGTVPYFSTRQNRDQNQVEVDYINYHLAESYRLYQNLIQAEKCYKQVVESNAAAYPLARLWYAVCLRCDNHVDEAITQLQTFIKANKANKQNSDMGDKELTTCLFAKQELASKTLTRTTKMKGALSGDAGDFGLSVNNGKYWFTSSRSAKGNKNRLNQVYFGNKDSSSTKTRIDLGADLKSNAHYGTPSLDASGKKMYLTIWHKDGVATIASIYLSKYVNEKWSAPQKLNSFVNANGYTAMQPYVTHDGKHLYFASNQPGSVGGTDIWMSDLNADGMPTNVANLGRTVNTAADEQAPYYSELEHKLVYSSKGFEGMGGFDLFESMNVGNVWIAPKNLGYPFNSTKDDLYYNPDDKDENTVYISSDRESECCLNLFKVKVVNPPVVSNKELSAVLTGQVIDCATSNPLTGVDIKLIDSASNQTVNYSTDQTGKYEFKLLGKHTYTLRLEKTGYFAKVLPVPVVTSSQVDTLFNPVICEQQYQLNKPIIINNILYDFKKWALKPEAKLVLNDLVTILQDNPKIRVELSSHTDSLGPDWSNNRLSQNRAQSCVSYIISKGISPDRITAKGYGRSVPLEPNSFPDGTDNPAARRLNRRTEFKVVSIDN